jgi:hypothetical protein
MANPDDKKVVDPIEDAPDTPDRHEDPESQSVDADVPKDLRAETSEALKEAGDSDYSAVLDRLGSCESVQELFEMIRNETNHILDNDPRFKEILTRFEGEHENLMEAVHLNDFSILQIPPQSKEYLLALRLTAVKNAIIAELTEKALAEYGEKLGVTGAEKVTILGFQEMMPHVDAIYTKWRQQVLPQELLDDKSFQKNPEGYLKKRGLNDPYAVMSLL